MRKLLPLFILAAFLSGCVSYSPSIPDGYSGPRATLFDSAKAHSSARADFFVAARIDGKEINNSLAATTAANQGRGMFMEPVVLSRDVPARSITVEIRGRTHHAAPILALTGTVYQVVGETTFAPEEGHTYVVTGTLGEEYSAIWIEDAHTREPVGPRVEINGSSKLGFFQK